MTIAARLSERRLNRRLAQVGLTTSALDALETAAELESTTVTDLASMLCVSSQSLGKLLRRLQNLGFLTRERGRDGRTADIRLTPKGREVLATAEDLVRTGTATNTEYEAMFRRHLEEHIRRLEDDELPASRGHHTHKPAPHNQAPTHYKKREKLHGYNEPNYRTQN